MAKKVVVQCKNGAEITDFRDGTILVWHFPLSLDPYDQLMYCENQECEGLDVYRFDGVYPETKIEFLEVIEGAK